MGYSKYGEPTTKQKVIRYGLLTLATIVVGYMVYYFSTGWSIKPVESYEEYRMIRIAKSYAQAEYSETSIDLDGDLYTDYWDEPASDVKSYIEVDGKDSGRTNFQLVKYNAMLYPKIDVWTDISRIDLDKVDKHYTDHYIVEGPFGSYKFQGDGKYHRFLQNKMAHKGLTANFHHGKFWSYSLVEVK